MGCLGSRLVEGSWQEACRLHRCGWAPHGRMWGRQASRSFCALRLRALGCGAVMTDIAKHPGSTLLLARREAPLG